MDFRTSLIVTQWTNFVLRFLGVILLYGSESFPMIEHNPQGEEDCRQYYHYHDFNQNIAEGCAIGHGLRQCLAALCPGKPIEKLEGFSGTEEIFGERDGGQRKKAPVRNERGTATMGPR